MIIPFYINIVYKNLYYYYCFDLCDVICIICNKYLLIIYSNTKDYVINFIPRILILFFL